MDDINLLFEQALDFVKVERFQCAAEIYRQILSIAPENPRALHSLGVVTHRGGGYSEEALQLIRQAIALKPDYYDARCNLGNMLNELRRFSEAEECYRAALDVNPDLALAWHGLGNSFFKRQLFEEAFYYYRKATELSPDVTNYLLMGTALKKLERNESAASAFRSALQIYPDCGEAYLGLASSYEAGANIFAASEYAQQALKLMPSSAAPMQMIAGISLASGNAEQAQVWYRRAVEAGGGAQAFSNMLFAMNYSNNCSPSDIYTESCRWQEIAEVQQESYNFSMCTLGRLRIGYVSPNFKQHSVTYFVEPLLKCHNRNRFEIHCYSNVLVPDRITEGLKGHVEYWHDLRGLSDAEAVARIREDRIDILIDLAGHTADNRLGIFARRAAPVQMTWLGYPNTTGVSAIDYRITDTIADPEGDSDCYHSERLIRLPVCFLCYQPPKDAPDVAPLPLLGKGYVTFGSFNNPAKITPEVVELWSRILIAVPNSRLLLKAKSFCDPELTRSYSAQFVSNNLLSPERIICVPATETISDHLAIYNRIDIALDTFPYCGTTTTFEALFMGVPVITLRGNSHVGRVGASILTNMGLAELVAETVDDYLSMTVSLCQNIPRLSEYHGGLRNRLTSSVLVDAAQFTDSIEEVYRTAWRTHSHAHPLSPTDLEEQFVRARNHFIQGKYLDSKIIYEEILAVHPDDSRSLNGMGVSCHWLGDSESAIRYISRAIQLYPNYPVALTNLGNIYVETGRIMEAIDCYRRALYSDPGYSEIHSNILLNMHYLPECTHEEILDESLRWTDLHGRSAFQNHSGVKANKNHLGKIRIGFVSPDFRRHPVAYFVQSFFEFHDRHEFEIFCYSDVLVEDGLTQILQNYADHWRAVHNLDDAALYNVIHHDDIDILVDLAGHTAGNRLRLFSMKPAPVQVTWAGYVGTTGLSTIDYLISDRFQSPGGAEHYCSEQIIRMPDDYISYRAPAYAPEVSPLPALSKGYLTFAVFNKLAKVSLDVLCLWSEILKQVEGACLLLKNSSFDDPCVVERYLQLFESHGISRKRIRTEGKSSHAEMMGRYADVDIQLDTFPYSGGLTTLESLWMGVPVITLPGERFSSRHSLTHLMNIGLEECVAATTQDYIAIACKLAGDIEKLSSLRDGLRIRMANSPLCDGKLFTDNLQHAFRRMLKDKCKSVIASSIVLGNENEAITSPEVGKLELVLEPDDFSRGLKCIELKDFLQAAECFEQVVAADPGSADAHNNLGIAYFEIGFRDDAMDEFKAATKLAPNHAEAWKNLGKAVRDTGGNPELAARYFRKALFIDPDFDDAWMMLGTTFLDRGRSAEAVKYFRKSLEMNPENSNTHSILLFAMNYILQFSQADLFVESLKWNNVHASAITWIQHADKSDLKQNCPLRIGYVSGDFKRHPVGYHLLPVLEAYDRENFEIYCYATLHEHDDLTEKMQGYVSGWRDITTLSDADAALQIYNDRIDILVDLSGHTGGNRLLLFARKPAPIQVSWLGYFNTTGVKAIDYLVSDETTIPTDEEQWFSEQIIRLPGSRFCYAPPEYASPVVAPPVLTNGFITFGSFNNIAKLTPEVIELWSKVLTEVPDSRLIIKWSTLARKKVRDRLVRQFARHGVAEERLFLRIKSPHVDMLKEYGDVDIALDPFPFSGGMTSCEALWMGVPVLTLLVDKPAGRQTAGFLRTIGLPEWVTNSSEQFLSRALEAASDYEKLKLVRFSLRERMMTSTLCDGVRFTRNLEILFRQIVEKYQTSCDNQCAGPSFKVPEYQSKAYKNAAIHYNDGIDQMEAGNIDEAIRLFELALLINPGFARAYNNLGILKTQTDRFELAETAFRKAIVADPSFAEAYYNLGLLCEKTGRNDEAIEGFNSAISINSEYGEAYLGKGNVMLSQGEHFQALECYEKAASLLDESAVTSNNMGTAYLQLEDKTQAELYFCEALLYDPVYAPAYINLGTLFCEMGRVSEAERIAYDGLDHFPDDTRLLSVHARSMTAQSRIPEALKDLRRALEVNPNDAALRSSLIYTLQYQDSIFHSAISEEQNKWSELHVAADACKRKFSNVQDPDRKLVIGYVSPDFGRHPVGYFLMSVLPVHDRNNFKVVCYSDRKKTDDQSLLLEANSDVWRNTSDCSDQELVELISSDCVDILIDLAGHTAGNRLTLFARKAAPIQISWLGYPNTTGVSTIDYRITDVIADPEMAGQTPQSERLIRLPHGFLCYQLPEVSPEIGQPPSHLNGYVTFGCFNNIAKITPEVINLWKRILLEVPESRLLLKSKSFFDPEFAIKFAAAFIDQGISSERISCVCATESFTDHLYRYRQMDIALDPFPYNGTTTTFETLYMGVPVITLRGDCHAGRVGTSILSHIGLEELIADSMDDFVSKVVSLSSDMKRLSSYHANLRNVIVMSSSPLFDGVKFTRSLEAAYREVWQGYVSGCKDKKMSITWEDLDKSDPAELFNLSPELGLRFPPIKLDSSVTIGMAACGNMDTTAYALRSLLASVTGDYELILVDDASPDNTGKLFELVPCVHRNTKIFRFPVNVEYSGSLNTILSHAAGDKIIFISNDIYISPAYIAELLSMSETHADSGLVRGCSNFVDNALITHNVKDCSGFDNFYDLFHYAQIRCETNKGKWFDDPFLTGDAFLVTRKLLESVGYLDSRFFGYFVDHDLGVRARQAGFRPRLALGAFAWHQHQSNFDYLSDIAKQEKLRRRWARININWAVFKQKYNLPANMAYEAVKKIPWDGLARLPLSDIPSPVNNSEYCLPALQTAEWIKYRATALSEQAKIKMYAGNLQGAEELCRQSLHINPDNSAALTILGTVQVYQGNTDEALKTYSRAVKVEPLNAKAHSNLLLCMNYNESISQLTIYRESKKWEKLHCSTKKSYQTTRLPRTRMRIVYISPDFRCHSVGYFFLPLLENHDRNKFDVYCLNDATDIDEMTKRMMELADGWRDISLLSDDEVEGVISEIAPDILVDLAGHTGRAIRLGLFSRKLAPIQITWLGYPNTTGLSTMDYRLTDSIADPVGISDKMYSEKLVRIKDCFLCYKPPEDAPEICRLPALKNGYVTFGSFNMLPKIQNKTIKAWSQILKKVPGSKLFLKNHYFNDDATLSRMLDRFKMHGITSDRLIIKPSDSNTVNHLFQYGNVDVALDTFPYNGTTTTCEALWMGVPVITFSSDRHSGRVGDSLLAAVGLSCNTVYSICEYVERAVTVAKNLDELSVLRSGLRVTMKNSILCSATLYARKFEEVLDSLWNDCIQDPK